MLIVRKRYLEHYDYYFTIQEYFVSIANDPGESDSVGSR